MRITAAGFAALNSIVLALTMSLQAEEKNLGALPFVEGFKPERYLGKWYEVARLPMLFQPAGTLAVAEYTAGDKEGQVTVENTALDKAGKKLTAIKGKAELSPGNPPGRGMG